ncbi:hypothetical protein BGZ99_001034 [Dissophora globulifera]|uniref:PAS domain-containing protein n=1 Tax=Dissophora globulifera TaxID=979702 RepID=A0A9P6RP65_9FUNG|nr:hypothetical protein BGZ99_001034 [Dissophora globulifera]
MIQLDNFISFHDLSPEGRFVWSSSSVYDVLGYTSDELVGVPAYDVIHPEDIAQTRVVHKENMLNDLVASQITVRYRGKDGRLVSCVSVLSICYDYFVCCTTVVHANPGAYKQLRSHSTVMARLVGSRKEEFERIKRHHEAFAANRWDTHVIEPEPRVCMILNRFSRSLTVMYASSACERIFHIDPDHIVGKPILLFIRADDLASFVEQMDMIKATTAITYIRFWFQSPRLRQEIPCEAMLFGAADGIVAVMRRCRPFIRKRFIGSRDHDWNYRTPTAAANINKNRGQSSSWTSASSASLSFVSSAASYSSMSPQLLQQDRRHITAEDYSNKSTSPPCNVPMSRISRIQILDLDQNSNISSNYSRGHDNNNNNNNDNNSNNNSSSGKNRVRHNTRSKTRPLAVPKNDPLLVRDKLEMPEGFGVKVYDVQDYVEEQDDDDDSGDDINDYGADGGSESNTRQDCDMDMDLDIS